MINRWSGLVRVSLPWATFGLVVVDGKIAEAAPVAGWSTGKPIESVAAYYRRRGGVVEPVDEGCER